MNIKLIPCSEINFKKSDNTVGYDYTVEDYETFTTGTGIFIYDTVAIYHPLTKEAQKEIKEKTISAVTAESINAPNFAVTKEMLVGLYTMTYLEKPGTAKKISSVAEAEKLHVGTPVLITVRGQNIKTTAGRVIFNSLLPPYVPFINEDMDGKKIRSLLSKIIQQNHSDYANTVDKFCKVGFKYATLYPMTISADMFKSTPALDKLRQQLGKEKDTTKQAEILEEIEKELMIHLKKNVPELYIHAQSGAIKGVASLRQIMSAKGISYDANGNVLPPITKSHAEGFDSKTFFEASASSRKGIIDRALNTAYGGYAYRKMIYAIGNVEADLNNADCGTKRTFDIKLTQDLFNKMQGRYVINKKSGKLEYINKSMIGSIIQLRSPVFCKSRGVCRVCYGDLIYQVKSKNIGIIACSANFSLSETIMKCSVGMVQINNKLISLNKLWNKLEQSKEEI
jgi:DNA-directed RNA polymerase subunit beta'